MEDTGLKKDLRTVRTKTRIKQAFLEVIKKKAFEKITVTEICKSLGINRISLSLVICPLIELPVLSIISGILLLWNRET